MEKLLRLLNPKTVNYEAIRVDNTKSELTAQDVILAMSFAKLTPFQDNLIRLKCLGANTIENVERFASLLSKFYLDRFTKAAVAVEYHDSIVKVALIEFCLVAGDYKPTERNRELISGFSDSTVRKHMKKHIDQVLTELNGEYELAQEKIFFQLKKTY